MANGAAPRVRDLREPVQSNEILVAIPHLDLVTAALLTLQIRTTAAPIKNDALGLARLALEPIGTDVLRRELLMARKTDIPQRFRSTSDLELDLDAVLDALREYFRTQYAEWVPVMGKNRLVAVVGESPGGVIIRDDGPPRRIDQVPTLWSTPRPDSPGLGVRVGVADTAVHPHPWIAGGWTGRTTDQLGATQNWRAGHATFLSGLILSQAPGAVVEARKVLEDDGFSTAWAVAEQIADFADAGFDILNLSFACYTDDGRPPLAIQTAIDTLDRDVVVVAAAGNHGLGSSGAPTAQEIKDSKRPAFPGALPDVVAVGAAAAPGVLADFSAAEPWVDVMTDGKDVSSTYLSGDFDVADSGQPPNVRTFNGFASWSGTSFAAALVSGAIAAGTTPGRVSARQAWDTLREQAAEEARSSTGEANGPSIPYLRVIRP